MQTALQIVFERMEPSDFLRQRIEREVAALEKRYGRITRCSVFVEGPGDHHRHGGLYAFRVSLQLPGGVHLSASRNPPSAQQHEDAYVALRDVFRALRRQLQEQTRARQDEPKQPFTQPHGVIERIFPEKSCGFIRADDGREIYFHKNAVLEAPLDALRIGAEVRFSEEEGRDGPQASTVHVYGTSHRS
jgi:cold shock CspA family protein/ribosome-associated translation inhibitor RaiA